MLRPKQAALKRLNIVKEYDSDDDNYDYELFNFFCTL
jgi:hypothetical protein